MTEISRPWTSTTPGDAGPYSQDNWAQLQRYIIGSDASNVESGPVTGSGVAPDPGLTVTQRGAGANMSVDISTGAALVNGTFYISDATVNKTIAANASGNPRIDTIVLNKDWSAQTVRLAVVQGTPAATPNPPSLIQTPLVQWQIPLGDVAVANGAVSITNANIQVRKSPSNVADGIYLQGILNNSGVVLQTGDTVVWDLTADRAVTTTTTAYNNAVAGVWVGRTGIGGYGRLLTSGLGYVNTSGAVAARGSVLTTSGTAKQALVNGAWTTTTNSGLAALGIALQTTGGAGLVLAYVNTMKNPLTAAYFSIARDNNGYYTTASATFANVDGTNFSKTIVTNSGKVWLFFHGNVVANGVNTPLAGFDFTVDGTRIGAAGADGLTAVSQTSGAVQVALGYLWTGTPGSHTFAVQFRNSLGASNIQLAAGNGTGGTNDMIPAFTVMEVV